MHELRPLVDEFHRLEKAAAALSGVGATSRPARRRRAGSSSGSGSGSRGRRGRPRGSGNRAKQALELVRAQPGITISEMASAMKIQPNYLYRVMPTLESEGQVQKRDGGFHPA